MRYFKGKQFNRDINLVAVGCMDIEISSIKCGRRKINQHVSSGIDETYIEIKEEWFYLYRTMAQEGYTLDIQLRKTRNHQDAPTIKGIKIIHAMYQ